MASLAEPLAAPRDGIRDFIRRHPTVVFGGLLLSTIALAAVFAPLDCRQSASLRSGQPLEAALGRILLGTDSLGRDVYARMIYGARISLTVGISVATIAVLIGLVVGLVAGYDPARRYRRHAADGRHHGDPGDPAGDRLGGADGFERRVVIIAIAIPEIPRVTRLVRSVVLSVRALPYVEAARSSGTRVPRILTRHILPSTIAPLIVQATYICASAILTEAGLSFLGAGTPPENPTWGNMIASSRLYLQIAPWTIFAPGICLALVVLAVNLLGDGLRDRLDPRIARRM